ncbi:CxxxxCH/CxxCH domain c-type cytochrome [Geobacter grbiciae]|uniref:CxxxxCH/CxxCH domain c-type cytochrome n=1 Tax=Geobacter grbiciae TaxID=155042 RepID=UPI001C0295DE|nr:CxxxxCH/CxxCH domain-containing protein [Geobacter grbiciae]MBT1075394.1 CxxxxCH/CxxCH domain-containing protein [Geobacter grbiciae]
MGTENRTKRTSGAVPVLVAFAASMALVLFVLCGTTPVHAGTITSCSGCHGMPPADAAFRNISTGGFAGNHGTHLSSPASAGDCTRCHNNSGYLNSHRDGKIQMAPNINTSPASGGGLYKVSGSAVTFRNQTSIPVPGSCSNVNCHFEAATPLWGSTAFTSPADCNKCHGAPPNGGTSGAAGSHSRHDQYYAGAANCQKCHSNNTTFQHATSAGHRNLNISFSAAPNNGSGAYSGPLNDYLPSQTNGFGTCTSLYCHSNGQKSMGNFSTVTVPTWGTPLPANCTGCHRSNNASGNAMATGSHKRHVGTDSQGYSNNIACAKCHAATVNGTMAIADTTAHVNAKVNIKFNSLTTAVNGTYGGQATPFAKDPGTAYGQCNNVYCHSNVQNDGGVGITYRQPTWGNAASGTCGTCHGGGNHFMEADIATGSHTKHLSSTATPYTMATRCIVCHNVGGLPFNGSCNNSCHSGLSRHTDGKIDLAFPSNFGATAVYNGNPRPGNGYSTCSNVNCHYSTTTPAWGTSTPINCLGCHTLAVLLASGAHAKHISATASPTMYNYTANRSTATEYDFGCSNCHPVTATGNHYNSVIDVTLKKDEAGVGSLRAKNSATAVGINVANSGITGTTKVSIRCSMAYCHSNGNAAGLVYATTPDWYGGSFTGDRCANCHGNAPNTTIAGSKSHYNNRFLGYTSNPGGHQIAIHAMGIYSSPSGLAKAGTGSDSSHGNAATSTTIGCNICHYLTVTADRNDDNFVCKTCHYAGNSVGALAGNPAVIADRSKHVNGTVDVAFKPVAVLSKAQMRSIYFTSYSGTFKRNGGYKTSGAYDSAKAALNTATMWDGGSKTCSNVACHNSQSVKWTDNDGATTCVNCHNAM